MNDGFIIRPGLPTDKVTQVLIGAEYTSYIHSIEALGINVTAVPPNPDIDARIACHVDMSIFHAGSDHFFITESSPIVKNPTMYNISSNMHIIEKCGVKYPSDVKTNACIIGDKIFCSKTGTSKAVIEFSESMGYGLVFVNQGYVKCSICVLDEKHIITDDKSIEAAAEKNGVDVFRYDGREICLKGFDKGFIGGSCGKISDKEIVFTGRFKTDEIERYIDSTGINVLYLSDDAPYDVGSIIPIREINNSSLN